MVLRVILRRSARSRDGFLRERANQLLLSCHWMAVVTMSMITKMSIPVTTLKIGWMATLRARPCGLWAATCSRLSGGAVLRTPRRTSQPFIVDTSKPPRRIAAGRLPGGRALAMRERHLERVGVLRRERQVAAELASMTWGSPPRAIATLRGLDCSATGIVTVSTPWS
jgi:hypothetical protein